MTTNQGSKRKQSDSVDRLHCDEFENIPVAHTSTQISKKIKLGKSKSKFEDYFKYYVDDNGKQQAQCLICEEKGIKAIYQRKNSNTSAIKKHLEKTHPDIYKIIDNIYPLRTKLEVHQSTLDSHILTDKPEVIDLERIIEWMSLKRLPFNFFDDNETQKFFSMLNPAIHFPKRKTIKKRTNEIWMKKKQALKCVLKNNQSEISFTIDGWSSITTRSYYGVTAHFIDENWILRSTVIDFIPSLGNHTGLDIAKLFYECLSEYEIQDKVMGITVDNVSSNTVFISELKRMIEVGGNSFDSHNQHFRCFAHIINLGVQDILKCLKVDMQVSEQHYATFKDISNDDDSSESDSEGIQCDYIAPDDYNVTHASAIEKIRKLFVKLRLSEQKMRKLEDFCKINNTTFIKPILDVSTRWHSTFDMINVAIKLKEPLKLLCHNLKDLSQFLVSDNDWKLLEQAHLYLKLFKSVCIVFEGEKYITLPLVIVGFNMLIDKLESIINKLDNKIDRNEVDEILLLALQAGRDKMLKHYRKCNWVYCSSLILDPRFKEETFKITDWGKNMYADTIEHFKDTFKLYYTSFNKTPCSSTHVDSSSADIIDHDLTVDDSQIDLKSLYVKFRNYENPLQEYEAYLAELRAPEDTDILLWWKNHEKKFPTLAKMAKDTFSIMATSVPCERLFSRAQLILTKLRNLLNDQSVRASMCLNAWVTSNLKDKIKKSEKSL